MESETLTRREHIAGLLGAGIGLPLALAAIDRATSTRIAGATYGSYRNREPLAVAEEWIDGHRTARHDRGLLTAHVSLETGGPPIAGADQAVRSLDSFFAAIGDRQVTPECALADDADVSLLIRVTGTHAGPLLDLASTGNALDFRIATFVVVQASKITRIRTLVDHLTLMSQIRGGTP